jgi:predicted nucleic acid-binding protein
VKKHIVKKRTDTSRRDGYPPGEMKLRVYTDTSVFSAYHDDRAADRKSLTREFWQNLAAYECSTSELAVEELRQTADLQLRAQMESLLAGFQIIPVTDEMRTLAEKYLLAGAFTRTMYNDTVHVAAGLPPIDILSPPEL